MCLVVCMHVSVCLCMSLSTANLTYCLTDQPNIICAHLSLYVQGTLVVAMIHNC